MIFDPMPPVHVYPYDMFEMTEHQTDNDHECWCEPRIVIVPPDHQFAKEKNTTRVFYHTSTPWKRDWEKEATTEEIEGAVSIKRLLRSIPEPPKGGWDSIELSEGVAALIEDITKNGWHLPIPPVCPPKTNTRTNELMELMRVMREICITTVIPSFLVDPQAHIVGYPGHFHCMDCKERVENCKCDNDDSDSDLLSTM